MAGRQAAPQMGPVHILVGEEALLLGEHEPALHHLRIGEPHGPPHGARHEPIACLEGAGSRELEAHGREHPLDAVDPPLEVGLKVSELLDGEADTRAGHPGTAPDDLRVGAQGVGAGCLLPIPIDQTLGHLAGDEGGAVGVGPVVGVELGVGCVPEPVAVPESLKPLIHIGLHDADEGLQGLLTGRSVGVIQKCQNRRVHHRLVAHRPQQARIRHQYPQVEEEVLTDQHLTPLQPLDQPLPVTGQPWNQHHRLARLQRREIPDSEAHG